jgi:ketosteroid isomerase-like protein
MNVKNGFNIMLFVIILLLAGIFSCKKGGGNTNSDVLLQADRDFSALSEKEGMFTAFLTFIADDGVILRDNAYPAKGKNTLRDYYAGKSDTSSLLTWKPVYADLSAGGDLGYTYGIYTLRVKATGELSRGTYVSVWKKQSDGTWKFVLDSGTQGLPE